MSTRSTNTSFVYLAGEPLGVPILNTLCTAGFVPAAVVGNPDRPAGRGQQLTPPPVKAAAEAWGIPVHQPARVNTPEFLATIRAYAPEFLLVVAYNHLLPSSLLHLPPRGTLNVHPSLLPLLRGASPIRSTLLRDEPEALGVSIILLDEEMDHGPIIAQQAYQPPHWPYPGPQLDAALAALGGELLCLTLPDFLNDNCTPTPQTHAAATYCSKLTKADAALSIDPCHLPSGPAATAALRTIYAYQGIGDAFFFHNDVRVKVKEAELTPSGELRLLQVTPAGKPAMDFATYVARFCADA